MEWNPHGSIPVFMLPGGRSPHGDAEAEKRGQRVRLPDGGFEVARDAFLWYTVHMGRMRTERKEG